ncbi:hypothetical protein UFOVP330_66 [uncultured Caudovirales phage]|uniref:Uncharacterized protein n=1 Tax=uncultured Caudovirales phage TaxID=2100421 RepID=A0A6J5LVI2_9CAUD|nr:hypothetical protein UFOVP330_66 [uncultured Caudovirales phage]
MAIVDRGILADDPLAPSVEVPVNVPMEFPGGAEVIDDGQGGAIIQALMPGFFDEELPPDPALEHNANLAEFLERGLLGEIASELTGAYEEDLQSRSDWEEAYSKGLDLLGVKQEERTEPFEGASGVTHPLISESVVQFQAQAYKELLPSQGPVKTQILGAKTPEVEAQAARVKNFMNYRIMDVMTEYDPGLDQMLFYLPLSGSTFKKVYFDPVRGREVSEFVPAQDLVVPYSAVDLETTPRATHVLKMQGNDVRKMQLSGVYRDIELGAANTSEATNVVKEKIDEIDGRTKSISDDVRTLLEFHADLDIEGYEDIGMDGEPTGLKLPYIVTVDKDTNEVLSIQRNWSPADPAKRKRQYFVHYKFMPGLGFYGFGIIHMIGGLGRASTSILRQLIDAGTLSNLPAGFKAKGIRVRDNDSPIQPGEWREIDAPGMDLRNALVPLPYKEPSATLTQLLGALVADGRRFISLADQQMSDLNNEAPVGTTVALLERGMKVMSAIHKRLHAAQKAEFKLLARVIAENLPQVYPYAVAGAPAEIMQADFDDRIDVIPVSDPNIFSMSQRVTLAQTELQLAQSAPEIHDLREAYRRMYQALEVENIDQILPPPPQPQPMDPAMEAGLLIQGQAPQAFPQQDHDAHIAAHMALLQMGMVSMTPLLVGVISSHIFQHLSLKAREIVEQEVLQLRQEMGAQMGAEIGLAAQNGQIPIPAALQQIGQIGAMPPQFTPDQIEARVAQVLAELMAEVLPQLSPAQQNNDPLVMIRMQELALRDKELAQRKENDDKKIALENKKVLQRSTSDAARIEVQEQVSDDRVQVARERIAAQMAMAQNRNQGQ